MTDATVTPTTPEKEAELNARKAASEKATDAQELANLALADAKVAIEIAAQAQAIADELAKAAEIPILPSTHVLVDFGHSGYERIDVEAAHVEVIRDRDNNIRSRTLTVHGTNVEHVDTNADGVWCYRRM
jgi:hypothetical protein